MALQSFLLDPNAQAYTDDEIVGKVNTASAQITRASSVAAAARPIADLEIAAGKIAGGAIKTKLTAEADGDKLTTAELAAAAGVTNAQVATGLAKSNLDAMTDTTRGYIKTNPTTGQFKVIEIQRQADGKAKLVYDDVAV